MRVAITLNGTQTSFRRLAMNASVSWSVSKVTWDLYNHSVDWIDWHPRGDEETPTTPLHSGGLSLDSDKLFCAAHPHFMICNMTCFYLMPSPFLFFPLPWHVRWRRFCLSLMHSICMALCLMSFLRLQADYLHFVTSMVFHRYLHQGELHPISAHSFLVYAAVKLHEAVKDAA